jgi:formate dehydrogenase iron-sulfur subunit
VAQQRIDANPNKYINHIYGVKEAGGTSVLYISAVPFEELGFPKSIRDEEYPQLTWNVLSKIPNIVSTAGVSLFGVAWIINRRMKLASKNEEEQE